jgi:hypothetical protein
MENGTQLLIKFNENLQNLVNFHLFKKEFHPNSPKEDFLIYSFGKAYKTHSAILILCKNGYGQDAAILARSLFELAITSLYILKDSTNNKAERWFDYDWIRRNKMYEYMKLESRFIELLKEKSKDLPEDPMIEIKRMAQEMQKKHNYKSGLGWSDKNIFDMTRDVNLESLYPTVYKLHTEIHHSGVGSINDYFSQEEDAIVADVGPSQKWVDETLVGSFHFFSILVEKWSSIFKLSLDGEIENLHKEWVVQVGKENKKNRC